MNAELLRDELQCILRTANIQSFYQPIIDGEKKKILGYEALTRGPSNSPLHSPDQMFKVATKFNLLYELEILCRQKSIENFKAKNLKGLLFINISPMALIQPDYPRGETSKIVNQVGLDPNRVVIELSEKYPMLDIEKLCSALSSYRNKGFKTAIDDLGSGYSDLRLWSQIRPDFVKIDRHFISEIDQDSVKQEFVKGISDLAKGLGCGVIAEGIETELEYSTVNSIGIDLLQGYYLSKPSKHPENYKLDHGIFSASPSLVLPKYNETAFSLCNYVEPINPNQILSDTLEHFQAISASSLPVVDKENVLGLIHKSKLLDLFSGNFGRALHAKKTVKDFVNKNAIIVEKDCRLDEISDRITNENDMYVRQHFVITDNGKYLGMGNTRELLKKITDIKLTYARYANPLTLLPGNVPIQQFIEGLIATAAKFYLAYFDIDNFKPYNDIYGYQKGDQVIQSLANLLLEHSNKRNDFVGHIGGDDFVVIFRDKNCVRSCEQITQEFCTRKEDFYSVNDLNNGFIKSKDRYGKMRDYALLSVSVGIVESSAKMQSVFDYSNAAAAAKKLAKSKLAGSVVLYSSTHPSTKRHLKNVS